MVAIISTVAFQGIHVLKIDVQVQLTSGLPAFNIVGLPDKTVAESRERIRSALHAIGLSLPPKRITVNLAPADVQKEGSHYDLPVALAILGAMEIIPQDQLASLLAMGELGLDGSLRYVGGTLPAAIRSSELGLSLVCPYESASEAAWVEDLNIIACPDILSFLSHIKGHQTLTPPPPLVETDLPTWINMKDIKGQFGAKRALEIAASGGHNLLMVGPPGAGKSMLAKAMPGILPVLEPAEALELTSIYSISGHLKQAKLLKYRPFRSPHHSASMPAMVGGGAKANPGEISLAHRGVLFLDELPEFASATLEAMRQPLEEGHTLVARANAHITYPAKFQLIAAMNPCKCGYLSVPEKACGQAPRCGELYQRKLSGPFLDRIDLTVQLSLIPPHELESFDGGEDSQVIKQRVKAARDIQSERYKGLAFQTNAELTNNMFDEVLHMTSDSLALMHKATDRYKLTARGYFRTMKVARTIADMEASPSIETHHVAEALGYRVG